MDAVDGYVIENPLARKQDVELYAHSSGQPLAKVLSGEVEIAEQQEIYPYDKSDCGGNCFI